jgi:hypothetical protein
VTRVLRLILLTIALAGATFRCATAQTATIPFRFIDNRIFVAVRINGHGPYAFIVDTGAGNIISTGLAHTLGIPLRSAGSTSGAGSKHRATALGEIATLDLGSLRFDHLAVTAIDLSEIQRGIGFARFDGVIGYDILQRFQTKVDMDSARLTLSTRPLATPAWAKSIPFTLTDDLIHVPARLDGVPGSVVVDTGDRSSLTLFRGFANAHHFYTRYSALRNMLTGYGVGGAIFGDVFRLPRLGIFDHSVDGVITRASRDKAGVFATGSEAGSIGGGVLRHFTIVYDYPGQRLIVWPSHGFETSDRYDTTGMWLATGTSGPEIVAVRAGGPAASAGLKIGDVISAINGATTRARSIPDLRAWFDAQRAGTRARLTVRSASGHVTVRPIFLHAAL